MKQIAAIVSDVDYIEVRYADGTTERKPTTEREPGDEADAVDVILEQTQGPRRCRGCGD